MLFALVLSFTSCKKETELTEKPIHTEFISAVDISSFPEISGYNSLFFDTDETEKDFIDILRNSGVNTIRLRLWINPENQHSGYNEVLQFSNLLKLKGFKIWLSVHYSSTWADPGQQITPTLWQGINYTALKDSVYQYTKRVVLGLNPDYIQIGNEINNGFLFPYGNLTSNSAQFIELLASSILAVREHSVKTKIIIHFAGIENANWFFSQINSIDYDIIGLSYYPIWHGKSLENLQTTMQLLHEVHQKKVLIAETAYPFTLSWNDWTNNVVGLEDQLILPEFPATNQGQAAFIKRIKEISKEQNAGIGFCYWGAELIAWKGNQSTSGSPWENQSIFDFENKALPVLKEF